MYPGGGVLAYIYYTGMLRPKGVLFEAPGMGKGSLFRALGMGKGSIFLSVVKGKGSFLSRQAWPGKSINFLIFFFENPL